MLGEKRVGEVEPSLVDGSENHDRIGRVHVILARENHESHAEAHSEDTDREQRHRHGHDRPEKSVLTDGALHSWSPRLAQMRGSRDTRRPRSPCPRQARSASTSSCSPRDTLQIDWTAAVTGQKTIGPAR